MELPSSDILSSLLSGDIVKLWDHPRSKVKPFLPFICKAVFDHAPPIIPGQDAIWSQYQKALHSLLYEFEVVNRLKKYLQLDFAELRHDALKEQQLIKKLDPDERQSKRDSSLVSNMENMVTVEFERGCVKRRFRLVLSETLRIMSQNELPFQLEQSDLFECQIYLSEMAHILCIAAIEIPSLLPLTQLSESLLRVKNGSYLICCLLANLPHCYNKVVTSLVINGESLDEISLAGRLRSSTLRDLVSLRPSQASYIQWLAYTHQKLPTLMIFIALDGEQEQRNSEAVGGAKGGGVLSLISDIVIHGDKTMKSWFAQYMKLMQQKYRRHRNSAVTALRKYLMKKLVHFINHTHKSTPPIDTASAMEIEIVSRGSATGEEREGVEEEEEEDERMDTMTLELVDQMEIEISEMEEETGEEEGVGDNRIEEKTKVIEIKLSEETETTHRRRHSSFAMEQVDFPPISLSRQLTDDTIVELTQLLHVCCGLKIEVHMYLTNEETSALLHLITCTCPPFTSAGVQFIEVALSLLLACPFLISSEEGEQAVVRWLNWLLDNLAEFEKSLPGECCYGEMLLLIVIHLQEKQLKQIEKLISSVLGMKTVNSLGSGHFSTVKKLFLNVFKESVVCSHAVSVPPTPALNGHMTGYLPIHCVHQLMRSKSFRKHGVSVKDWVYKQLCCVTEPLHPILPPLIEEYVQAVLLGCLSSSRTPKDTTTMTVVQTPFTAEEVLNVFDHEATPTGQNLSSQILILYYVLFYQDTYLGNLKQLLMFSTVNGTAGGTLSPKAYSPNILLQLPVKRLLQHVSTHQEAYRTIYSSLLRLIISHFPYLCLPEDWIKQDMLHQGPNPKTILKLSPDQVTVEAAQSTLDELGSNPSKAFLMLSHLSCLPTSSLISYTTVLTSTLCHLLHDNVSKRLQQLYLSLWTRLNSIISQRLWVETVNALRPANQKTHPPYTHQNLVEDPLIVLRCDTRVFRCPAVFEILLRILAAYSSASRVWLLEHAHILNCTTIAMPETSSGQQLNGQEREELRIALTAAQESSMIQLLLEICLPNEQDKKDAAVFGPLLTSLREIQCLVCSYLHQVFISEPSMVKLIHFQGYPPQLLPLMVSGVPSMHIVMDFMSEFLAQPQLEKQVFAVQLAAYVTNQYPLPESLGVIRDIFKRLHRFTEEIPSEKHHEVFIPLLPFVTLFCETFPPLSVEATDFLLHLCRICLVTETASQKDSLPIKLGPLLQKTAMPSEQPTDDVDNSAPDPESINSADPLFAMEAKLTKLKKLSLSEAAELTFNELIKNVVLKVSGKR